MYIVKKVNNMKIVILFFISFYRKYVSPLLTPHCRFYPTCSEYSYESIFRHGIIKGTFLTIIRICKCHPFHPGGFDPVKD